MARRHGFKWNKKAVRTLTKSKAGALMEAVGTAVESQAVSILSVDQLVRKTKGGNVISKRKRAKGGRLVAETKATAGAAPRVLTGRLRQSVAHETIVTGTRALSRIGTNVKYGVVHEKGDHPWLVPAMRASKPQIRRIIVRLGSR